MLQWLALTIITGGSGLLLFLSAMSRDLNHDEHQFIAPGVLIAREGHLPYRDFPIFHLPNLAFVYAALDRFTDDPIWAAKCLNALASTIAIGLILLVGTATPSHLVLSIAVVVLLLTDQLFTYTAGKTWNHELPAVLLIAAIVSHVRGVRSGRGGWFLISGACVGAAIGTRLTYAPVAAVFPALLAWAPLPRRARALAVAGWSAACLLALTPSLYFLVAERSHFLFDNLQFPRLRLADPTDTRVLKTMTWWRKLRFFFKEILAHSLPLSAALLTAILGKLWPKKGALDYGLKVTLLILPAVVLGCFLPSRYQYQHYFAVAPLTALALVYSLRDWQRGSSWVPPATILAAALVSISFNFDPSRRAGGLLAYREAPAMLSKANWFTTRLRQEYGFAPRIQGKVLTLAPAGILEAGGRIYPAFATGPFAWRSASLLAWERRHELGLVAPEDVEAFLAPDPPAAILTGVEDESLEEPLVEYASAHSYRPEKITKRRLLWTR